MYWFREYFLPKTKRTPDEQRYSTLSNSRIGIANCSMVTPNSILQVVIHNFLMSVWSRSGISRIQWSAAYERRTFSASPAYTPHGGLSNWSRLKSWIVVRPIRLVMILVGASGPRPRSYDVRGLRHEQTPQQLRLVRNRQPMTADRKAGYNKSIRSFIR